MALLGALPRPAPDACCGVARNEFSDPVRPIERDALARTKPSNEVTVFDGLKPKGRRWHPRFFQEAFDLGKKLRGRFAHATSLL